MYALASGPLGLGAGAVQTMIYLNLSVGGIFTLYSARTRGPFWSVRPGAKLLGVTLAAQLIATVISVYGLFMSPIGWTRAAIVWGYCTLLFLLQDQVKLGASRIFRPQHSGYFARHAHSARAG